MKLELPDPAATEALAARIAPHLRAGHVIALQGGLGAGKTTFCRALISALLGAPTDVPSPTYTLVQTYYGPGFPIYHFDLYRLKDASELNELGWEDTFDGLSLVEWPDKAGERLPAWRMTISLEIVGEGRVARLEWAGEDWQDMVHEFED
ncbi:MAG: tRNA (adenosine(37)-N6)-threonylcarbamoyltransferase complex ATPase subunit type 1 TsaE [Pseudomonadota bacterium]